MFDESRKIRELMQEIEELKTRDHVVHITGRAYRATDQTITNNSATAISFSATRFDTGGFWDVANATRLTIPVDGVYIITGHCRFDSNATGRRYIGIRLSGGAFLALQVVMVDSSPIYLSIATTMKFTATQYIELMVYQNSGGNLDIISTANYSPEFSIAQIA